MQSKVKWFYPGMRVKRWLLLVALGVIGVALGSSIAFGFELFVSLQSGLIRPLARTFGTLPQIASTILGLAVSFLGVLLVVIGIRQTIRSVVTIFLPESVDRLADIVFERRQLQRGPRVVAIGGGTGLSTLLRGLKEYTSNITAVVTMADDGGSSGRLRSELGIPPPGDIRNTLVALADTEPLMARLFQHRFHFGEGLKGHSFGNLFIAAMCEVTGDFETAVKASSKVLAVRGKVLPSTLESVVLKAEFFDGTQVIGESRIPLPGKKIRRVMLSPAEPPAFPEVLKAIREAEMIVLGPGSLYTSILPNLLVPEIAAAVKASPAMKVYICNVMTQPGETDGYSASDHVRAIVDHLGEGIVDFVIVNRAELPSAIVQRYRREGATPVRADVDQLEAMGLRSVADDLIDGSNLARHDPGKLAAAVMDLFHRASPMGLSGDDIDHWIGRWTRRDLLERSESRTH